METNSNKSLRCVVVTPERAVLDEVVESVALPMYDGELGVLPGRLPLIGRLGYGELRFIKGGATHRYFVDGGFAQVRADVVTVLTSRAIKAEDIKVDSAQEALRLAQHGGATPEEQETRLKKQLRARGQIRVAQHAGIVGEAPAVGHH